MKSIETGRHYPLLIDALPIGWKIGYIGTFTKEIQPGFASGKHNKEGLGIPHIRPFNIDRHGKLDLTEIKYVAPESDAKRLHSNDVLFNNTNSPELVGKTTVISKAGDWGFSNHMTRLVFNEYVSPKFAAYQLNYLWMDGYFLYSCVKHVNQASVSSADLAKVPFVIPSRDKQEALVAEIEKQFSRLDEAVAGLKRIKTNLKRYKASVLKAAVEGKLTEEWRKAHPNVETGADLLKRILVERKKKWEEKNPDKKYKEPVAPDTSSLPKLPNGWVWATIDQLSVVVRGGSPRPAGDPKYFGGKIPWITVGPLTADAQPYLHSVPDSVTDAGRDRSRYIEPQTLLLTNSGATLGVPKITLIGGCINDGVAALLDVDNPLKLYMLYFLRTLTERLRGINQGAAQPNLNTTIIKTIAVPLPQSIEQQHIVKEVESLLSVADEIAFTTDSNLKRAERLRQSILKQAFSGQLLTEI